ncbi:MAG: metalloregulator ArsR/SmtB family transcription factor [Phycisphaerae bacterium]
MQELLRISKALSDEQRVRALAALLSGEMCLCQIIEILALAPSTVSKHMSVLREAGLVTSRKEGRWQYYRLAEAGAAPQVRGALRWVRETLAQHPDTQVQQKTVDSVRRMDVAKLCACYRT